MDKENIRDGQLIHYDEFGEEYVLDELGNKITPRQSKIISEPGEFTVYDSTDGHCGLCGQINCNGGCFK